MHYTLLLILITGFIIAAAITYLAESWRCKRVTFSSDIKSNINSLFMGSLSVVLALGALFIYYDGLRECKDVIAPRSVERKSIKSSTKEAVVSKSQLTDEKPSSQTQMKKVVVSKVPILHEVSPVQTPMKKDIGLQLQSPPVTSVSWSYTVQIGAFRNLRNHSRRSREVKQEYDVAVFTGHAQVGDTKWYRLFVGHFQTAKEARQFGQSLERRKLVSSYLVRRILYTTLLGSFTSEREIKKYIKNRISEDIHSYIISPAGGGATDRWFLAAGAFTDKKSAEKFAADMRNRGYRSARVTRK